MTRLKLPAYGKQLLADRRAGKHPHIVTLIYGERWQDRARPLIAIKPEDYAPGKFDFRLVAGVCVHLIDQAGGANDCDAYVRPPVYGKFYELLRELGAVGAFVVVYFSGNPPMRPSTLEEISVVNRWYDREADAMRWPQWWSEDLQERQIRAHDGWLADFYAARNQYVEQKQAERERAETA